jgi:hypothetical protein
VRLVGHDYKQWTAILAINELRRTYIGSKS